MNKLLIVLLAICLVSVHAFVKRDAPVTEKDYMKNFSDTVKKAGEDMQKAFQPEAIKERFNEFVDGVNKLIKGNADKPPQ